jgi:protein SCO1
MHLKFFKISGIIIFLAVTSFPVGNAFATENPGAVPDDAAIIEKLGDQINTNVFFTSEDGKTIKFSDLMLKDRPAILVPVYFSCPRLCGLTMSGVINMINDLTLKLGSDYTVIALSFNDQEGFKESQEKVKMYGPQIKTENGNNSTGLRFVTGTKENIKKIMDQVGFNYQKDQGEFIHQAVSIFLSPTGKITRYFYGIDYHEQNPKLALVEAGQGKIGSSIDKMMLFCFRFDPTKGRYTLAVLNVTRIVSLGFVALLAIFLIRMRLKEKTN